MPRAFDNAIVRLEMARDRMFPPRGRAAADSPAKRPRASKAPRSRLKPKAAADEGAKAIGEDVDADLRAERDRLLEKFAIMQSDLGGALYEMAIRDHVRMDVLTRRAAELQQVDAELSQLERSLELQRSGAAGSCASCGAPHGHGVVFCAQCGQRLVRIQEAA